MTTTPTTAPAEPARPDLSPESPEVVETIVAALNAAGLEDVAAKAGRLLAQTERVEAETTAPTTEQTAAPAELDLDAIRRLVHRATGSPWTLVERQDGNRTVLTVVAQGHGDEHDDALVAEVPMSPGDDEIAWRGDGEFIAAARALLPACADEINRLRAELAARKPIIDAVQAWAELVETDSSSHDHASALITLHQAAEQYRLTDLPLTTARNEQPTNEANAR
ncbi:hypothetical protein [Micromonospora haikouensis]|uniref:hypothetical protein n=1 Tax=Micromonospora haikouensis TaxID=686309 RepID=UPI003D7393AC